MSSIKDSDGIPREIGLRHVLGMLGFILFFILLIAFCIWLGATNA